MLRVLSALSVRATLLAAATLWANSALLVAPAQGQFYQQRGGGYPQPLIVTHTQTQIRPPAGQSVVVPQRAGPLHVGPQQVGHAGHIHGSGIRSGLGWYGGYGSSIYFNDYAPGLGYPLWGGGVYAPIYAPQYNFYPPQASVASLPVASLPAGAPVASSAPLDDPSGALGLRNTNAEEKAKAGRFMAFGDTHFGKQKYLAASERYRTASQVAPDLAEPYLRQAFACVALAQYESAARAFRRALSIRPTWDGVAPPLDGLYAGDQATKNKHLDTLAAAVEANGFDSNLLMVLGLELYFNGEIPRSEVFLSRAAQLGGNSDHLLDAFLGKPRPSPEPTNNRQGKVSF